MLYEEKNNESESSKIHILYRVLCKNPMFCDEGEEMDKNIEPVTTVIVSVNEKVFLHVNGADTMTENGTALSP